MQDRGKIGPLTWIALAGLFLAGLVLSRLDAVVWYDEMATWLAVNTRYPWDVVRFLIRENEPFPPLYFLVVHFFVTLLGDSAFALRLPSLVAGAASLPALYFAGKKFYSEKVGWIAAAIGLFAWSRLAYASVARPYTFLFLGSMLFGLLYWEAISRPISRRHAWALGITAVALAYTHFFGLVLVGIAGLHALLFVPRARKIFLLAGVAYLPWLPNTLFHLVYAPSNQNIPYRAPLKVLKRSLEFHLFDVDLPSSPLLNFAIYATWALLLACALGALFAWQKKRDTWRVDLFLLLWLFLPLLLVILKSEVSQPVYRAKYLIISGPALILLLARGLGLLWDRWFTRALVVAYVGLIAWLSLVAAQFLTGDFGREEEAAAALVRVELERGATLVPCSFESDPLKFYFRHEPAVLERWPAQWRCEESSLRERMAAARDSALVIWFVAREIEPEKVVPTHYRLVEQKVLGANQVWRLERVGE